jgi:hypothetical protein
MQSAFVAVLEFLVQLAVPEFRFTVRFAVNHHFVVELASEAVAGDPTR